MERGKLQMITTEEFGAFIDARAVEKRMKYKDIAAGAGVSKQMLLDCRNASHDPSILHAGRICTALGCELVCGGASSPAEFGEWVGREIARQGLTVGEVARRSGLSSATIRAYKYGSATASLQGAGYVSIALGFETKIREAVE